MARRGLPSIPSSPDTPKRKSFIAQYHGRCGACGDEVSPGDECHYVDDEVCHEDCE